MPKLDWSWRESINPAKGTARICFDDSHVLKQAFGRMEGSDSPKSSPSCVKGLVQEAEHPQASVQVDPHFLQAQGPLQGPFFAPILQRHFR
jgi:hypothetical protein